MPSVSRIVIILTILTLGGCYPVTRDKVSEITLCKIAKSRYSNERKLLRVAAIYTTDRFEFSGLTDRRCPSVKLGLRDASDVEKNQIYNAFNNDIDARSPFQTDPFQYIIDINAIFEKETSGKDRLILKRLNYFRRIG